MIDHRLEIAVLAVNPPIGDPTMSCAGKSLYVHINFYPLTFRMLVY